MTGVFQTTLSPVYTSDKDEVIHLKMHNRKQTAVLVKVNDSVVDDVVITEDDGSDTHFRHITLMLHSGDVVYAQADLADEIRFTISKD